MRYLILANRYGSVIRMPVPARRRWGGLGDDGFSQRMLQSGRVFV
jgi:hypothetical protein